MPELTKKLSVRLMNKSGRSGLILEGMASERGVDFLERRLLEVARERELTIQMAVTDAKSEVHAGAYKVSQEAWDKIFRGAKRPAAKK